MEGERLRVGELARRTGKTVRAIRYYEELGLLEPAGYTRGGFRLYAPEAADKIRLIERFHALGFSLEEIARIVQAFRRSATGDDAANRLGPLLRRSVELLDQKISLLMDLRRELDAASRFVHDCVSCPDKPGEECCPMCTKGAHDGRLPTLIRALVR